MNSESDPGRSPDGQLVLKRASPKTLQAWLSHKTVGIEDYVVAKDSQGMHRRDRTDFQLQGWPEGELFMVINEPALYLFEATDGGEEHDLTEFHSDLYGWVQSLMSAGARPDPVLALCARDEPATQWRLWQKSSPRALSLDSGSTAQGVDHACRMARAQWRRGGAFALKVARGTPETTALKHLKSLTCKTSAAYLLYRKKGILTNGTDQQKYHMAKKDLQLEKALLAEEYNEVFVEQPEGEAEYPEPDEEAMEVSVQEPSQAQKDALQRVHQNLGHPDAATLARTLRVGGAPDYL